MTVKLNGEHYITQAATIAELLRELQAPEQGVAVALNYKVIPRPEHATTALQEDDEVELVRAVQGG